MSLRNDKTIKEIIEVIKVLFDRDEDFLLNKTGKQCLIRRTTSYHGRKDYVEHEFLFEE